MKSLHLSFLFVLFLFSACVNNSGHDHNSDHEANTENQKDLLGKVDKHSFQHSGHKSWFDSTYQAYQANPETIGALGQQLSDIDFKVFMGSWCSDSQREIPAFYRILDEAKYDLSTLQMIAVDRDKAEPATALEGFDIEYVPTFILYRGEEELGRIIESPEKTLEEDMLAIAGE